MYLVLKSVSVANSSLKVRLSLRVLYIFANARIYVFPEI